MGRQSVRLVFERVHVLVAETEMVACLVDDDVGHEIGQVHAGIFPFCDKWHPEQPDSRRHFGRIELRLFGQRNTLVKAGQFPLVIEIDRSELLGRGEIGDLQGDIGQMFAELRRQSLQRRIGEPFEGLLVGIAWAFVGHRLDMGRDGDKTSLATEPDGALACLMTEPIQEIPMAAAEEIFARLKEDHDRHRELLDKLLQTSGDTPEREQLFEELTKELKAHAAAEEQALYSTMLRKPPTTDDTRHSVAEHHEIEEALNDLAATEMSEGGWLTKFKTFDHDYRHHIDEEEDEHFPEFAEYLTEEDEKHMKSVFERRKKEEKESAEVTPEKKEDAKE